MNENDRHLLKGFVLGLWSKTNDTVDVVETFKAEFPIVWEILDKPIHTEPDEYTASACFQFRANEALQKIEEIGK